MDKQVYQRHCINYGHHIVTMVISEAVDPRTGSLVREVEPRCTQCNGTQAEIDKPPKPMRKPPEKKISLTTLSDPMESPPGE